MIPGYVDTPRPIVTLAYLGSPGHKRMSYIDASYIMFGTSSDEVPYHPNEEEGVQDATGEYQAYNRQITNQSFCTRIITPRRPLPVVANYGTRQDGLRIIRIPRSRVCVTYPMMPNVLTGIS